MNQEDNEYLTRVGPDTPMGNLLRRYWMPVMLESEVPGPNMPPVASRVMGEDCLVWRDANGGIGLFQKYCMHRRVSLSLAQCEGDGLRCIFHGWKFGTSGEVLEIPNQPDPKLKDRLRAPVYPTKLSGGLLWVYMGPRDHMPVFPHYAFMDAAEDELYANRIIWNANFVQGIEGNLDSSHIGFLHNDVPFFGARAGQVPADTPDTFLWDDNSPKIFVEDHPFGFVVAAVRDGTFNGKESFYGRVHNYIFPFATIVPAPGSPIYTGHVPIDDTTTITFNVLYSRAGPLDKQLCGSIFKLPDAFAEELSPDVQRYLGSAENNWFQDRSTMDRRFSGLERPISQDLAALSSRGAIVDRSKEVTISSDAAVVRMHRMLIAAARDLENGIGPPMPSDTESRKLVCGEGMLEEVSDWSELLEPVG